MDKELREIEQLLLTPEEFKDVINEAIEADKFSIGIPKPEEIRVIIGTAQIKKMLKLGYRKVSGEPALLSDEEIGDLLDLEKEFTYPCSDGSKTITVDCHKLIQAQLDKCVRFYALEAS